MYVHIYTYYIIIHKQNVNINYFDYEKVKYYVYNIASQRVRSVQQGVVPVH